MFALQMKWRDEICNIGMWVFMICIVALLYTYVCCFTDTLFCLILTCQTCLGNDLKGLVDAADNYHKVLAENQKLFNEVQELKGIFLHNNMFALGHILFLFNMFLSTLIFIVR